MRRQYRECRNHRVFVMGCLFAKLVNDRAAIELANLAPEGLLGKLVGEESATRGVAVVGALVDAVEHLLQGAALHAEDRLAFLVSEKAQASEGGGEPLKVFRGEERIDALLHVGRLCRG